MSITPKSAVALAMYGAGVMAAAKLGAVLHDGSSAMLASTVHSLIDVSFLALLIYGLAGRIGSDDRKSAEHAFWTAIVPILLYALGAGVTLYDGIEHVARPRASAGYSYDELLLAIGVVISSTMLWLTSRSPEETRQEVVPDPVRSAVTLQAAASAAGQGVAFAGVAAASRWGMPEADGMAAAAVGLVLIIVAAIMALEAGRLLRFRASSQPSGRIGITSSPASAGETLPAPETKSAVVLGSEPTSAAIAEPPQAALSPTGKPQVVARHAGKKGRGKRRR